MSLHIAEFGAGTPLVLLHGWGLHGGIWSPVAGSLARDVRVLVPDLPGCGQSTGAFAPYTLSHLADALVAQVASPAVWVGWSLGALIALTIAQRHPSSVQKLILVGATSKFVRGPGWACAMDAQVLADFAADLERDYAKTLQRFLSLSVDAQDRASLRLLRESIFSRGQPERDALRAGLALLRDSDLRAKLPAVTPPTLVLHGGRDKLVPLAAGEHLAATLPAARLCVIADAGHAPFLSHPQEFVESLRGFVHA